MMETQANKPFFGKFFERQLSKGELRKAQIIEKTIEIIGKLGIENTSFDAVAHALKVKASHINYYFPTRASLIEGAIKFVTLTGYEIIREELSKCDDPKKRLEVYIEAHFRWLKENPDYLSVMLILFYYSSHQKDYRAIMAEVRNRGCDRIQEILKPFIKNKSNSIEKSARAIQSLITGNLIYGFTLDDYKKINLLQAETVRAAKNILRG